jgi:cell division protein FtsI (penicillin-binding protein 3)
MVMVTEGSGSKERRVRPESRHRIFLCVVFAAVTAMFGYLLFRLVRIQVIDHDFYAARAARYHLFERHAAGGRGRILDRSGAVLAESVPVKSLWARPGAMNDLDRVAATVAAALGRSESYVARELRSGHRAVRLAASIDDNETITALERAIAALEKKGERGLDLHDTYVRRYPFGRELAHVVGSVGTEGEGLFGIERLYDSVLAGSDGRERLERDGRTRPFVSYRAGRVDPTEGGDVVLTIDMVVQHFLERQVQWAYDSWSARSVIGVVLAPRDGTILAMANRPTFDPERLATASADAIKNRAITDPVAPGSTFKPFVVAAALEEGTVRPGTRFDCGNGKFRFENRLVNDVHPERDLDVAGVLVRSSNIGVAQIGRTLGGKRLQRYVRAFGFGEPTGIGLGGESRGIMTPPDRWTETYTTVSVSFGQEISCTALQLAAGFGALVNGGRYQVPRLVDRVLPPNGIVETPPRERESRDVISPGVSALVRSMLVRVCEEGSGQPARVPGYRVGGKTGTSEKFEGKVKRGYISSFVAFAPAEDPEVCVVLMVDDPKGAHFGRVVAAPAVGRVLADCLAYLEVPPSYDVEVEDAGDGDTSRSAASGDADRFRIADTSRGQDRSRNDERAW